MYGSPLGIILHQLLFLCMLVLIGHFALAPIYPFANVWCGVLDVCVLFAWLFCGSACFVYYPIGTFSIASDQWIIAPFPECIELWFLCMLVLIGDNFALASYPFANGVLDVCILFVCSCTGSSLVRLLCVPWRHKKSQRLARIDSRMLSTTVPSPCQTLHELL